MRDPLKFSSKNSQHEKVILFQDRLITKAKQIRFLKGYLRRIFRLAETTLPKSQKLEKKYFSRYSGDSFPDFSVASLLGYSP